MSFAERLKEVRTEKALTQQEMADILQIPKNTYIKYERGMREPKLALLQDIAQTLHVSLAYLLGECEEPSRGANVGNVAIETVIQNPDFFNQFDNYGFSLKDMVGSFISQILGLEYGCVDLFYMQLKMAEEIEHVYSLGKLTLEGKNIDLSSYDTFLKSVQRLRRQFDDFICLIETPNFYKEVADGKYHFSEAILDYRYEPISSIK